MEANSALQDLIHEIRSAFLNQIMDTVGWTIYIYDYFETLDAEVRFVWGHQWALGKILFLLSRYYSHFDNAFRVITDALYWDARPTYDEAIYALNVVDNVNALVLSYVQIAILMLCVHGLLGATRTWKIACITIYMIMLVISSTLMINHLARQGSGSYHDSSIFRIVGNYWVFFRSLGLILLGAIALYSRHRGYKYGVQGRRPLLSILRRDGSLCYLGILGTTLWAFIVYTPGYPDRLRALTYSSSISRSVTAILANRLIINLRKKVSGQETQAEHEMSLTTLHFADNHTAGDLEATALEQGVAPRQRC